MHISDFLCTSHFGSPAKLTYGRYLGLLKTEIALDLSQYGFAVFRPLGAPSLDPGPSMPSDLLAL
jgi:hypothetical protein